MFYSGFVSTKLWLEHSVVIVLQTKGNKTVDRNLSVHRIFTRIVGNIPTACFGL